MTRIVQEKFQVRPAQPHSEEEAGWVSQKAPNVKKDIRGRVGRAGGDQASKAMNNAEFVQSLPPGQDLEDQEFTDQRQFKISMGGTTDVSKDYNETAVKQGFTRKKLATTDDEYTGEHADIFYGEITVDGDTGFVERANLLDRM